MRQDTGSDDIIYRHTVPGHVEGIRLSDYAIGIFPGLITRSGLKKAIKRGEIFVEGSVASTATLLYPGCRIEWRKPEYVPAKTYKISLEVVYEDDYLAVVNKPAGISVSGNRFDTVENALAAHLHSSALEDALPLARAIHRLDKPTSGLLVVAKTRSARVMLGQMFERKEFRKGYQALVIGKTPENGVITDAIQGKEAITSYERVAVVPSLVSGYLSLLDLYPETGRNHQIRIHLSQAGFPILGDKTYGDPGFMLRGKGLFLSAVRLKFRHPVTGEELGFNLDTPLKFRRFMEGERKRWEKYGGLSGKPVKDKAVNGIEGSIFPDDACNKD